MRILCVIPTIGPGGAERVMSRLLAHLAAKHSVTLLTFEPPDAVPFYPLPAGVEILRIDMLGGGPFQRAARILSRPFLLRQAVKKGKPDVVLSFMDTTNITTIVACLGLGVPVIVSERIDPGKHAIPSAKKAMRRFAYPQAKLIVVPTRRVASFFPESLQPKIRVIGNPIAPPAAKAETAVQDANGRKRIVAVGRYEPQKGYDRLISAFALIANEHPQWDLVIIGDGAERTRLEDQLRRLRLESRIQLKPTTPDVFAELAASHVMAFPSHYEGFPNALAEGLSAGLPAVGFHGVSGVEELIVHGKTGLLVEEKTGAIGFAQALSVLMSRADIRVQLGGAAQQHVRQWAPEQIFALWDDAFAEAVRPR
jgi:GalNAc-alpha-(1->4)-GalNAc-alpha-(1->3)-diNAcBac-PP-undecaprenol alpha-1,4-N-acetyl-D-galactosaminyltransferase